jgi:hypothetical protein
MKASRRSRSNARERRQSHINPAAEIRQIKSDLSEIAVRFGQVSLEVNDTRRAQRLAALSLLAERASTPLAAIARDLERGRL